jgi:hypothetical protein
MKSLTMLKWGVGMAMALLFLTSCHEDFQQTDLPQPALLNWETMSSLQAITTESWTEIDGLQLPPGSRFQIQDPHILTFHLPAGWQFVHVQADQTVSLAKGTSGMAKCTCEEATASAGVKCTVNFNTQNQKVFCMTGPACKSCKLTVISSERTGGSLYPVEMQQGVNFEAEVKKGIPRKCFPEVLLTWFETTRALSAFEQQVYGGKVPEDIFTAPGKLSRKYQWAPIRLLGYHALFAIPRADETIPEQEPPNGGNAYCRCLADEQGDTQPGFCFRLSRPGSDHLVTCSSHHCDDNCWVIW